MGKYIIKYTETAIGDLQRHKKSGNKTAKNKIATILSELGEHPHTGVGQPERLKHQLAGFWSRRINQKDRIIYTIEEDTVTGEVISAMVHYNDK